MALNDGSANAPVGTIEYSGLLNGYAARPNWSVAGVDYYVGAPSGATLKNPATLAMSGVSVNTSSHIVTVSGSNVTLDGYDFSLNGGWQVNVVNKANNVTIQNSYFKVGANNQIPVQADSGGSINVMNNTFDGGASNGSNVNSMIYAGAGATIEYNRFTHFPNDGIDITHDGNYTIQYNLFDNMSVGDYHTDAIQTYFSDISSIVVQYNTMYQPTTWSGGNAEMNAFFRIGDEQGHVVHNPVAAYNTIVMPGTTTQTSTSGVFQWWSGGTATLVNPLIHDNYINPTGVLYSIVSTSLQDTSGVVNPVVYNNVDMTTGKQLLSGPYENRSSGVPSNPPATPVITGETSVSATQVKLSGTAQAGTIVDVYDQNTLLGTVNAGTGGAWTFTTSQLATGDHSFTARATDAYTNSSASSAALAISVTSSGISTTPSTSTPSAPSAPTIASFSTDSGVAGDGVTNDNTVELKGSAAANSTVKIYDGTTQIGSTTATSTGSWDYITSILTDAKHTLSATTTNASGQTSVASAAVAVTVDTKAPAEPTIASDTVNSANQVVMSGTAEANSAIKVFEGTTQVGTATTNSGGAWSVTTSALSSGSHVLTAKATDVAGNVSAASTAVDPVIGSGTSGSTGSGTSGTGTSGTGTSGSGTTASGTSGTGTTAPAAPKIASFSTDSGVAGDHITSDKTLTLAGTAAANSTVEVFDGATQLGTATADANGAWHYSTAALPDGKHSFTATDTVSGLTSKASTALDVTVDTAAPDAPVLLSDPTTHNRATVSGTAEAGSSIKLYEGTTLLGTATVASEGDWSVTTPNLKHGSHTFTATATDAAGNTSALSQPIDPPIGSHGANGTSTVEVTNVRQHWDHTATIKGIADPNSEIKLSDGTTSAGSVTAGADGKWSFHTSDLSGKSHAFTAEQVDTTGHVVGTSSGEAIIGTGRSNTLTGTSGNDVMVGKAGADTFVFASNFGQDVIKDFVARGPAHDTVEFGKTVFDSFASVLSHAAQSGGDVVIPTGSDTLTLKNTKLDALNSHDFHFA